MTKKKSIGINAFMSVINSIMSILFPLITFPYITRILGVEDLGRYNFAKNFVDIFCTLAFLGIPTYAIREGAKIRNNKEKIDNLLSELFTIGLYSSISVSLFTIVISFMVSSLRKYTDLISIFVIIIPFKMMGQEWIYNIYEDFTAFSLISVMMNAISIILMFVFIHTPNDLRTYALITVISTVGTNVIMFFWGRKYCKVRLLKKTNFKKHGQAILVLFSTYISIMIYNKTDTALLGLMCGDYQVGIYSVSTKIYNMVKSCLLALTNVLQAQAVINIASNQQDKINEYLNKCFNLVLTFVMPCIFGIIITSRDIIKLISGDAYLVAQNSLIILSVALFFSLFSTMQSSCILIPNRDEMFTLKGSIYGAGVNLILNFIFIPLWKENGAALTTLIAEAVVFFYYFKRCKKYYNYKDFNFLLKCIICCFIMGISICLIRVFINTLILRIIVEIVIAVFIYGISQIFVKNPFMIDIFQKVKEKCYETQH
jgi:O-antigen/teichoic acid export membrane protein